MTSKNAKIIKTARRAFLSGKFDLLEKAAQTVADAVLNEFSESLKITVKKPQAPIKADFDYVAVEIERNRNGVAV